MHCLGFTYLVSAIVRAISPLPARCGADASSANLHVQARLTPPLFMSFRCECGRSKSECGGAGGRNGDGLATVRRDGGKPSRPEYRCRKKMRRASPDPTAINQPDPPNLQLETRNAKPP